MEDESKPLQFNGTKNAALNVEVVGFLPAMRSGTFRCVASVLRLV